MVWPVAFPLEAFLTRAGITALGSTAASEGIKSLQNQGTISPNIAREAFMRTLVGPTTEILNRTTDTPSGKVFAPTGEIIEPNQIPGMAPAEQPQGLPGLLPPQQEKQVEGMSQASPPTKDKGFTMPATEDMSTLYNVENDDPLNVENIQNKIKYKKSKEDKNITEAYLGDKKVGELEKMTEVPKMNGMYDYQIYWTNEQGEIDPDSLDVQLGFNSAKDIMATRLWNTIKSQEKEYLNKFIKAVENKDYDTLNKIREEEGGYDFEGSEFRSKEFKDTIDKYRPDLVKLSTKAYNEQQQAISELNTKDQNLTTKKKPSLTEVDLEEPTTEFTFNEAEVNSFPFNPIDFEKNGILNNPEIIKAFDDLKDDIKIKPPVGFDKDYMVLHQSDSFYVTPPRGQMEITLKYLKKQLEENKASEETVDLIKNLEKDLQAKIKKTGYYGENKEIEDKITNLPGITNKLKKLKGSN